MKRLPHIRALAASAHQRDRLARWLTEWELEKILRAEDSASAPPSVIPLVQPDGGLAAPTNTEPAPQAGQVRLLHPSFGPRERMLYVAVLEGAASGRFVVAPFGRFSEPAVPGELRTGRDAPGLRVLCLWNTRTLNVRTLSRSWVVDSLSAVELTRARAVWECHRAQVALPAELESIVGAPVRHPLDPRVEYLEEERELMDEVDRPAVRYDEVDSFRPLAMAADQHVPYGRVARFSVEGSAAVLIFTRAGTGDDCVVEVRDDKQAALNGAVLQLPTGERSNPIRQGRVTIPGRFVSDGLQLLSLSGRALRLSRMD